MRNKHLFEPVDSLVTGLCGVIHWNLGPKVACAPHSKTIAKRHMGLGFLSSQSSINLLFITVHPALYEDLIPYVHVAHDLESLVRSTKPIQSDFVVCSAAFGGFKAPIF
jgi:hypothetical protein